MIKMNEKYSVSIMKEREKLTNWLKKTSFLKLDEEFELSIPLKKARLCKSGFSKPTIS